MTNLVDNFDRAHDALRVSVTDRCNLRCRYCMPEEGIDCQPREELLSYEALTRVISVARELGIEAVRLTGGEPLVRRDLPEFVGMLREAVDLREVAMTTNGMLLDRHAEDLAEAGVDRVNISIDSPDRKKVRAVTHHGDLDQVWEGIEAAAEAELEPIKVNALVLEGFNDDEFGRWIEMTHTSPLVVRFMELMPIGEASDPAMDDRYVDLSEKPAELVDACGLEPADAEVGNGPARYWRIPGAEGKIGFITPRSNPYCQDCSRLRLTSTGHLRPCLASEREVALPEEPLDCTRADIASAFHRAVGAKPSGHRWNEMERTPTDMATIGG